MLTAGKSNILLEKERNSGSPCWPVIQEDNHFQRSGRVGSDSFYLQPLTRISLWARRYPKDVLRISLLLTQLLMHVVSVVLLLADTGLSGHIWEGSVWYQAHGCFCVLVDMCQFMANEVFVVSTYHRPNRAKRRAPRNDYDELTWGLLPP